jgi:methionine-S-sulfoxide reductase
MNSASMKFIPLEKMKEEGYGEYLILFEGKKKSEKKEPNMSTNKTNIETITFGGGCFWGVEELIRQLPGVVESTVGYMGGNVKNPKYELVKTGTTGHAEVVQVKFDPKKVSLESLLKYFFRLHDPTTVNRQGNDVGTQYRSVIFYANEKQKIEVEKFIEEINASNKDGESVKTEVVKFDKFYEAEDYHKNYFETHPGNPYCEIVINPKLEKVKEKFADILKSL